MPLFLSRGEEEPPPPTTPLLVPGLPKGNTSLRLALRNAVARHPLGLPSAPLPTRSLAERDRPRMTLSEPPNCSPLSTLACPLAAAAGPDQRVLLPLSGVYCVGGGGARWCLEAGTRRVLEAGRKAQQTSSEQPQPCRGPTESPVSTKRPQRIPISYPDTRCVCNGVLWRSPHTMRTPFTSSLAQRLNHAGSTQNVNFVERPWVSSDLSHSYL